MKKFILNLIFILLVSIQGFSQTGRGYLNYRAVRTHSGNGTIPAEYSNYPANSTQFDAMFDLTNPANTLIGEGEVIGNSAQGTNGGHPPGVSGSFFAVEYTGWFLAKATGSYTFYLYSDDASEVWIGDTKVAGRYSGQGATSGQIVLEADTWYPLMARYQEFGGGDFFYVQMYSSMFQGYYNLGDETKNYPVSNTEPVIPLHYDVNFKFGNGIDPSTFSVRTNYRVSENQTTQNANTTSIGLDGLGEATITSQIDETLYSDGTKKLKAVENTTGYGAVLNSNGFGVPGQLRFYIDDRMFDAGFDFSTVTQLEMLDLYTGPIQFHASGDIWKFYKIDGYGPLTRDDISQSNFYLPNGYASGGCVYEINPQNNYQYPDFVVINDWVVEDATSLREQFVILESTSDLQLLVDDVFTVSDVYLAFKELANSGIGMNEGGNEYQYGIQYAHSDVNRDGVFNFEDTFMMLDWLNGGTLFDTSYLAAVMKLTKTSEYNSIASNNWNTHMVTRTMYPLNLNTTDKNYDIDVTVSWLGDVNLSHSPTPTNNLSITGKSMIKKTTNKIEGDIEIEFNSEIIGENLVVTLKLNPLTEQVVGTQFRINYDSDKLTYTTTEFTNTKLNNFHTNRGNFINLGSISTDGSILLDNTTEYKLTFKTNEVKSGLGLVSIKPIDAVNKVGNQLKMVIK